MCLVRSDDMIIGRNSIAFGGFTELDYSRFSRRITATLDQGEEVCSCPVCYGEDCVMTRETTHAMWGLCKACGREILIRK